MCFLYIHSAKLINFKSIGDYPEAEVILEPRVTAIIGKNESGKSNVLEGLSYINFLKRNQAAFAESVINRNSASDAENIYEIILKPTSEDIQKGIGSDTKVIITKSICEVAGGFVEYYKQNILQYVEDVSNTLDEIGNNPFQLRDQDLTNYRAYKQDLMNMEPLKLYKQTMALDFLYARIGSIPIEHRSACQEKIGEAREKWTEILGVFPQPFYRKMDLIIESAKAALTEKYIKEPHLIKKSGTADSGKEWFAVGEYKKLPNEVGGMETTLPEDVHGKMKTLLAEYNAKEDKTLNDILEFHVEFERIHPFQDGNGRVGRLIMFKECLKYNIVPFIIEDNSDTCLAAQDKYKTCLDFFRIEYSE